MKLASFFNTLFRPTSFACALLCILAFHPVQAKPESIKPITKAPAKTKPLVLDLPADELLLNTTTNPNSPNADIISGNQWIVANKRKKPLNLGCGMDVFQSVDPTMPLSNRLTGECELKYRY